MSNHDPEEDHEPVVHDEHNYLCTDKKFVLVSNQKQDGDGEPVKVKMLI